METRESLNVWRQPDETLAFRNVCPQQLQGMEMSKESMKKIIGRRKTRGTRKKWHMGVHGLMTVLRVLPDDLYRKVMESDEPVKPGETFDEIVQRLKWSK